MTPTPIVEEPKTSASTRPLAASVEALRRAFGEDQELGTAGAGDLLLRQLGTAPRRYRDAPG